MATTLETLAPHVFTTRHLQFLGGSADADYLRLARHFRVEQARVLRVSQIHGREVLLVRPGDEVPAAGAREADAVVVTSPGLVASVRVADCVPLLIADRQRRVVAAIHAGWRGTAAGVSAATVQAIEAIGIPPTDLEVAIGPSIGPCCYQVDDAVRERCIAAWPMGECWLRPDGNRHWTLDLWRANRDQLEAEGVPRASIQCAGLCTADHLGDWYSHRKEGAGTGRMVAAIHLTPGSASLRREETIWSV